MSQTTETPRPTTIKTDTTPSLSGKSEIAYSHGAYHEDALSIQFTANTGPACTFLAVKCYQKHHGTNRLVICWYVFIGEIEKRIRDDFVGTYPSLEAELRFWKSFGLICRGLNYYISSFRK